MIRRTRIVRATNHELVTLGPRRSRKPGSLWPDNLVDDIPLIVPDCAVWLRGDRGVTPNGPNISNWTDLSGNGNDAPQPVPAQQPLIIDSHAALNNRPGIETDGPLGTALDMPALDTGVPVDITCFAVMHPSLAGGVGAHYVFNANGGAGSRLICEGLVNAVPHTYVGYYTPLSGRVGGPSFSNIPQIIRFWFHDTDGGKIYRNGGLVFSHAVFDSIRVDGGLNAIGAIVSGETGSVVLCEFILYIRALAAPESAFVENYLFDRYNLAPP